MVRDDPPPRPRPRLTQPGERASAPELLSNPPSPASSCPSCLCGSTPTEICLSGAEVQRCGDERRCQADEGAGADGERGGAPARDGPRLERAERKQTEEEQGVDAHYAAAHVVGNGGLDHRVSGGIE